MRKILIIAYFFVGLFLVSSCGKDKTATNAVSDSGSTSSFYNNTYSNTYTCKMINGGNLGGCCSSHGGAKNCSTGMYQFTSDNKLICSDGTISPTCIAN